ncbi:hypothetical protein CYCD_16950 [Tenuifilaceae bacterium CYCD]|nr:hypothetical protein CYCD_16950 [Tenuifilaceae bacterium CYCD]
MKRIFLVILSIIFGLNTYAQTRSDLISREKIAKNKIASVSQWTHKFVKDKIDPKGTVTVVTNYDKGGNPIEVINYKPDGRVSSRHVYKYDDQNRKIEYSQYQFLKSGKDMDLSFKQTFSYDSKGNKKSELGFDGKTTYRIVYSYFDDGKQKEIVKYNASNTVEERWVFENKGNTTNVTIYKPEGKVDKKIVRKYDNRSNLLDETNYSGADKELGRTTFEFGSDGLMKAKCEYYGGSLRASYSYVYDDNGQLIEVYQTNPNGDKMLYSAYKYDGKGNMLEEKWFDGQPGEYSKRNFKLDNRGNVNEVEAYYSDYNYKVVYRYTYKYN